MYAEQVGAAEGRPGLGANTSFAFFAMIGALCRFSWDRMEAPSPFTEENVHPTST